MPHPSDPLLQAYVDGVCNDARGREIDTHLQDCAACRDRMEQARSAAARASELLAVLDPGPVHAPSFAELQARAAARGAGAVGTAAGRADASGAGRGAATPGVGAAGPAAAIDLSAFATPRKPRLPLWRHPALAWAATVVIAFLLGWLSRPELGVPIDRVTPGGATSEAPAAGADRASPAPAELDSQRGSAVGSELEAAAKTTSADDVVAPPPAAPASAGEPVGQVAGEAGARQPVPEAMARQEGQEARRAAAAAAERAAAPAVTAPPPVVLAEEIAPAGAPSPAERNEAFADAAPLARSSVPPGFVTVDQDAATAFLGAPPRTLPDMPLVGVTVGPGALLDNGIAERFAVRMTYRAPTGQEVVLQQQYTGVLGGALLLTADSRDAGAAGVANAPAPAGRFRAADERADRAVGDLDAALDALDLPATTRDPDGRVTYQWVDAGGYLLSISALLDADVVRGLADRVR